ncbi:Ribosome biogenesis protein ERB Nucleolus [Chondrus crispus]|uniref:Ribosome biogenesis protein BOP1 homolog n=1 Tax=Chondrus crispus TaxID=2769 RepID=R7QBA8_CHOCR|nr:Ribosome biogenesis protein ERB Nucleolus [Chondrus crispus]CDF34706.1 Ribosome biogenesis protein ERB Nucleolus [Chondrus crispus]|eukprot:XP_005714525.1 Ribosome biogenesis protein ERB Nucleolus [Chondrus crispus]
MVSKKARRETPGTLDESPVVSDDDGIDISFVSKRNAALASHQVLGNISLDAKSDSASDSDSADDDPEPDNSPPEAGAESDSSSDGDENPVGDIPMRWYDGYEHIGYTRDGDKILPKNKPSALDLAADPSAWRRVYDEKNDKEIVLTHEELKAIARMRVGRYPSGDVDTENELIAWSGAPMKHALTTGSEPKRRFLPSRHEARLVVKLVRGMRAGVIKRPSERAKDEATEELLYQYDAWADHEPKTREEMTKSERARDIMRLAAPKPPLPTHGESYNPPAEYLPNEEEAKKWNDLDPEDRETQYLPAKHSSLRQVPLYENFIKERFERCLDLYLAVRVVKDQTKIDPEELIPDLPSPKELRPFPTNIVSTFGPLPSRARSIDVHPAGQWLLSGSDDGCVRLWEVGTGHLQCTWNLTKFVRKIDDAYPPVSSVAWCPKDQAYVFAATIGYSLVVVGAASAMGIAVEETGMAMENQRASSPDEERIEIMKEAGVVWEEKNVDEHEQEGNKDAEEEENPVGENRAESGEKGNGNENDFGETKEDECHIITISHPRPLRTLCWHRKGDYIACVGKDGSGGTVAIHRLSHRTTQMPFKRKTALVQAVKFHPTRPFFLVATMHHVRIYNLALQRMVKTLKPGVSWISSIDVHPSGDHVLVTSYDKRLCWFDLDLSIRPYKTIRNHDKAVRTAKYHPRLPLFADASDDGSSHIFHGMVYDDLAKNALIVPVKRLESCSKIVSSLGVLDIAWHPRLPWLFTSGADSNIHLLTDCSQG